MQEGQTDEGDVQIFRAEDGPQAAHDETFVSQAETEAPVYADDYESVSWKASEYIHNQKNAGWFMAVAIGAVLVAVLVYLIGGRSLISAGSILAVSAIFAVASARPPKVVDYRLTPEGIDIDTRTYPYEFFQSFSLVDEHGLNGILLTPLKRFMAPITIYYEPKDEELIIDHLSHFLPEDDKGPDAVDRLMKRIRF